jgi:AAA ATPase domain
MGDIIVDGAPMKMPGDPAGLPSVGGGFVGRERELDRIGALLMGSARLVTLIGPGGIGKTRLAEEAARRLHRARYTPVFAVRLATRLPKGADGGGHGGCAGRGVRGSLGVGRCGAETVCQRSIGIPGCRT